MDRAGCDSCKYVREVFSPIREYVVGEKRLAVRSQFAWCHGCQNVVLGEWLDPLDQVEEALHLAESRDPSHLRWSRPHSSESLDEFFDRTIASLHLRKEWRTQRVSPPRCLECGSFAIAAFPYQETHALGPGECGCQIFKFRLRHPGCRGDLVIKGHRHTLAEQTVELFTAEGQRQ